MSSSHSSDESQASSLDMEVYDDDPSHKKEKGDAWPHEEIVALLSVWKRYVAQLDRANHKKEIYDKMSDKLRNQMGVGRGCTAVQEMITKMKGLYKKNMPSKPNGISKWRYWRAVDEILGEPDSEDESFEEEEEQDDLESTEEEVAPVIPPKKPRGRPPGKASAALKAGLSKSTPPKKRKIGQKLVRAAKVKKPPPRDEILEKMLARDKEYDVVLSKLNGLFEDTTQKVLDMQQRSNDNIVKLATNLKDYIDSLKDKNSNPAIGNPADNSLMTESPYGIPPTTNTTGEALIPFLRSVIGQLNFQKLEQNLFNN